MRRSRIFLTAVALVLMAVPTMAQRRRRPPKEKTPAQMNEQELFNYRAKMLKEGKLHFGGVATQRAQCETMSKDFKDKAAELGEEPEVEAQRKYYLAMADWFTSQEEILKKLEPWKREEFYLKLKKDPKQETRYRKIAEYNKKLQIAYTRVYNNMPKKPKRR